MRNTISIIAAATLALVACSVTAPAEAHHGNTGTALIGIAAGTALGLEIGDHRSAPVGYQGGGYGYAQPQPVYVPQPRPAPNGAVCMAWNGFNYIPVARCGN